MILPFDLIRARRSKGIIRPRYLDGKIGLLETLIRVFNEHLQKKRGSLEESLSNCEELGYDYKLVRGLSTVLFARCTFQSKSVISPLIARSNVFIKAAGQVIETESDRLRILSEVATKLNLSPKELDESLYADLDDEYVLVDFEEPSLKELTQYYNYALTVALLAYSKKILINYNSRDEYIERLSSSLGESTKTSGKENQSMLIELKPTKRLSQRGAQIDDLLGVIIKKRDWVIQADITYPPRYKVASKIKISYEKNRDQIKKDPLEEETIIMIPSKTTREQKSKYGEVIFLEDLAYRKGMTVKSLKEEIMKERRDYTEIDGVLILPDILKDIQDSLKKVSDFKTAKIVLNEHKVKNHVSLLKALGYEIEWGKPRENSRIYKLW